MLGRGIQQLLDALGAIGQDPFAGDVVRVVLGHDFVIGGHDFARGRVVALRQILERDVAVPVVFRVPARRGRQTLEIVRGFAHRHAPGRDIADVAFHVRIHHVLLRRMKVARSGEKLVPVTRGREFPRGLHGQIVLAQRSPRKRQREILRHRRGRRLEHIGNQRAVARAAHGQRHIRLALYLDRFAARGEFLPALRREDLAGVIDALHIKILHVRPGIGEAPGNGFIAPEHHGGHARQGRPHHFEPGRGEMSEVPYCGRSQAQVRIVGEERLAARSAAARQHPVVGCAVLGEAGKRERGEFARVELPIQRGVIGDSERRIARIRRQEFADLCSGKIFRQAQAQQFRAPVRAQVPGHHFDPGDGVCALPGFGLDPGEQKFRRQGAGALREKCIDPGRVGIELTARLCVQCLQRSLRDAAYAQGTQELVGIQARRTQRLGQASAADAPVHFHLPQPILGVDEA